SGQRAERGSSSRSDGIARALVPRMSESVGLRRSQLLSDVRSPEIAQNDPPPEAVDSGDSGNGMLAQRVDSDTLDRNDNRDSLRLIGRAPDPKARAEPKAKRERTNDDVLFIGMRDENKRESDALKARGKRRGYTVETIGADTQKANGFDLSTDDGMKQFS